jgi:head-tail adaptor
MPLLSGQLARQRERAERDLTGLAEIHRYTETSNDMGESIKAWVPVATLVPCRVVAVGAVTGRERLRLDAMAQVTNWVLVFPWNTDITSKDRVYVTSPTPVRAFDVTQVLGPHTDEVRRRAMVDEVS